MKRFKVTFGDIIRRRRVYSVVIHAEDMDDARDRAEGMDFDSIVGCGLARKEFEDIHMQRVLADKLAGIAALDPEE